MNMSLKLELSILPGVLAICRLEADARIPDWGTTGDFLSITRTPDELSLVCPQSNVPEGVRCEQGWRCLKVAGPLDFALTGILAALATPLAQAGISIFAVSTYDTDYVLVRDEELEDAVRVLRKADHSVRYTVARYP